MSTCDCGAEQDDFNVACSCFFSSPKPGNNALHGRTMRQMVQRKLEKKRLAEEAAKKPNG